MRNLKAIILSSGESKDTAHRLQALLQHDFIVEGWDQGTFKIGQMLLLDLIKAVPKHDFAIIVFDGDDLVTKRGETSAAPRDNVIFEAGLCIGILGIGKVFIVAPSDIAVAIPTDLGGFGLAKYDRTASNRKAALQPTALEIKDAIEQLDSDGEIWGASARNSTTIASVDRVALNLLDALSGLTTGVAGVRQNLVDRMALRRWQQNVVSMLHDIFRARAKDIYASWLRPNKNAELQVYLHKSMPNEACAYRYRDGEGLAGQLWKVGGVAAHSTSSPHSSWVVREGCESSTYIAACAGEPLSDAGLLAIGSNVGFPTRSTDESVVRVFATLLALSCSTSNRRSETVTGKYAIAAKKKKRK